MELMGDADDDDNDLNDKFVLLFYSLLNTKNKSFFFFELKEIKIDCQWVVLKMINFQILCFNAIQPCFAIESINKFYKVFYKRIVFI